ncbi:MAG: hypothetical protein LBR17_03755 [Bacteroidales bacterium]|jgi:hypothetical protein|nr:hypothetical protein [Bacteroidales bacterium]
MKTRLLFILAAVLFAWSCENNDENIVNKESQLSNLTFTACNQDKDAGNVSVQFTNTGIHITHYGLPVTCDFDTVLVSYTFNNGVLRITEQGSPNEANCICYTDVSYTINNLQQNNVNVIFVNGEQVWCHNDPGQGNDSITTGDDLLLQFFTDTLKTLDSVYLVNTPTELALHNIPFASMYNQFTFDLNTNSLLIFYSENYSGIDHVTSSVSIMESLPEQVLWNVYVYSNIATVVPSYVYVKRIPKISSNVTVNLNKQIIY